MADETSGIGPAVLQFLRDHELAVGKLREQLAAKLGHEPEQPAVRGERQKEIARLPGFFSIKGLTAGEVSREANYDEANTYTVLDALVESGLLEVVPGSSPRRWRLALEHRRNKMLSASRVIEAGEWTTYGNVAVAVTGHRNAARAVGRMAARHPAFANPHRVIMEGGSIPPGWEGYGGGPEECRRRLEAEGVRFIDDLAEPTQRITWEVIEQRVAALEADEDLADAA